MLGNRFIDNNVVAQKYRDRDYQLHQQKIKEIKRFSKKTVIKGVDQSKEIMGIAHQLRNQATHFQLSERQNQIKKENKALLETLIQIGDGKRSQFRGIWDVKESNDQSKMIADTTIFRSQSQNRRLHSPMRRQQLKKIEEENYQLAQRIIQKGSTFNPSEQRKHIQKYEQLKNQMRKTKKPNSSAIRLPPMIDKVPERSQSQERNEKHLQRINDKIASLQKKYDSNNHSAYQNSRLVNSEPSHFSFNPNSQKSPEPLKTLQSPQSQQQSISEQPKENSIQTQTKEEPKAQNEPITKQKQTPKQEVQEPVKQDPKVSPKNEIKEEPKLETKEESKQEPKQEAKQEEETQKDVQEQEEQSQEAKDDPKEENVELKEDPKEEEYKEDLKEEKVQPKEDEKDEPKDDVKVEQEKVTKEEPKEENQDETKEQPKEKQDDEDKKEGDDQQS